MYTQVMLHCSDSWYTNNGETQIQKRRYNWFVWKHIRAKKDLILNALSETEIGLECKWKYKNIKYQQKIKPLVHKDKRNWKLLSIEIQP